MNRTRKTLIAFSLVGALISGCSDHDEENLTPVNQVTANNSGTSSLTVNAAAFMGKIDGQSVSWQFGTDAFQVSNGYQEVSRDSADHSRYLVFELTSDDQQNRVTLYSPAFNAENPSWATELFKPGQTRIGGATGAGENFQLAVKRGGKVLKTGEGASGELEVLKTDEFLNPMGQPSLRVWLRINTTLQTKDANTFSSLDGGTLVAEFWDYKTFK